jgi:energy-coupling factor transporter transmembrane protein EcfT
MIPMEAESLMIREPSPEARIGGWLLVISGAMIAESLPLLLSGWLVLLLGIVCTGQSRRHLAFILIVLLPLALVLVVVWWGFVGAPPNMPRGSAPTLGLYYALRTVLRLGIITAGSQLTFLTIRPETIWPAARRLGLSGQPLSIVLASFALGASMTKVVDQTVATLKARGAIRPNRFSTRVRAVPILIVNIWNRLLADQFQRVELKWAPQRTLQRVETIKQNFRWSGRYSLLVALFGAVWMFVCILSGYHG